MALGIGTLAKKAGKAAAKKAAQNKASKRQLTEAGRLRENEKTVFEDVGAYIKKTMGEVNRHILDMQGKDRFTGKTYTKARKEGIAQTERPIKGTATNRKTLRKGLVAGAALSAPPTAAISFKVGQAVTDAKEALPENPTQADAKKAMRSALKNQDVPTSYLNRAMPSEKAQKEKMQDVNRRKALEDVRAAEEKRNAPPMPPKRPDDMNKGGYMKKSRTGSMDYRKGGLFR